MFDITTLVLGEVAKVEELSGHAITEFGDEVTPKGKMMAALAFVVKRRSDPAFKWNDALGLTMEQAQEILGITATDDTDDTDAPSGDEPGPTS